MNALLFALSMFFLPVDHKHAPAGETYSVPLMYSMYAYEQASLYENVEPEDVLTILVGEHGWRAPYDPHAIEYAKSVSYEHIEGGYQQVVTEKAVNWGLLQINRYYLSEYNKFHGVEHSRHELLDWRFNIRVGTYNIHRIKNVESSKRRKECREGDHFWTAHWTCASGIRNEPRCQNRKRLHGRVSQWKGSSFASMMLQEGPPIETSQEE